MSEKDLQDANILLPEELWGRMDLHSTVNTTELIGIGILGTIAACLMYIGDGTWWSWIGGGLFFLFFLGFYLVSSRAIKKQNRRLDLMYKVLRNHQPEAQSEK